MASRANNPVKSPHLHAGFIKYKLGMSMKKDIIELNETLLVGISTRTNNQDEMTPDNGKIPATIAKYDDEKLAEKIKHRNKPRQAYCVYTDFDSDENGEYTYLVGEEVSTFDSQDQSLFSFVTLPAGRYCKFTTEPGVMPQVVIEAWQEIWQMQSSDFGGQRSYIADFEVYDHRCADPNNAVVDIYIGIKTS